jgi:alkylhydroperoxidase/carboxymuconolactone decarboxylase family protein YurZ
MDTYYKPEELTKFEEIGKEVPILAKKFFDYYKTVFAEGELTEREKSLIGLAVAHTIQSAPIASMRLRRRVLKKAPIQPR